jgi:hypothetical protein
MRVIARISPEIHLRRGWVTASMSRESEIVPQVYGFWYHSHDVSASGQYGPHSCVFREVSVE